MAGRPDVAVVAELAGEPDMDAVASLWLRCFDDGPGYVRVLLDVARKHGDVCVARAGGDMVSSLALLPFAIGGGGLDPIRCLYLCELCTAPGWRRHGIARELVSFAANVARQRGCAAVFLQPESDALAQYYLGLGYRPATWRARDVVAAVARPPSRESNLRPRRIGAAEYNRAREELLADSPHAIYGDWWVGFAEGVFAWSGGGLFDVGGGGVAAAERLHGGEAVDVRELLPAGTGPAEALPPLLHALGASGAAVSRPLPAAGGDLQLMAHWLDVAPPCAPSFGMPFSME